MCMVDDADGYPVFSSQRYIKRARKAHHCCECGRAIAAGEACLYDSSLFDGSFSSDYTCPQCDVARQWLSTNCGGYMVGSVREDIAEHVDEFRHRRPACMARLMRLHIGMRLKWRIKRGPRAGQLMPPPQLPCILEPKKAAA